jgi:NAD+--asparagine ADP-ribosyltransferase
VQTGIKLVERLDGRKDEEKEEIKKKEEKDQNKKVEKKTPPMKKKRNPDGKEKMTNISLKKDILYIKTMEGFCRAHGGEGKDDDRPWQEREATSGQISQPSRPYRGPGQARVRQETDSS